VTPSRLIASGFGLGFAPKAPGTVASAATVVLAAALAWVNPAFLPLATLVAILLGLWSIRAVARAMGGEIGDPGWIVIDEIAGQFVALLGLARLGLLGLLAAFLLFRLLDITKPGPVGWADRRHGPEAVIGDDLIAGAIVAGILWAVGQRFPGILGPASLVPASLVPASLVR
jgi:phosphatidylglycerophosphatase A